MKKLKIGVIGLGGRGYGMMRGISKHPEVEVVAVCDEYQDRIDRAIGYLNERFDYKVVGDVDYKKILDLENLDAPLGKAI